MFFVVILFNVIVYGFGYVKIMDMIKVGLWFNLVGVVLISVFSYFLVLLIFNWLRKKVKEELFKEKFCYIIGFVLIVVVGLILYVDNLLLFWVVLGGIYLVGFFEVLRLF